ncbi:MAG: hypothetical protein QNL70_10665 [Pseudomonas sp.]
MDEKSRPVFEYRVFEAEHFQITSDTPLHNGEQHLTVDFDYDGGGWGKGGVFTLKAGDNIVAAARGGKADRRVDFDLK